MTNEETFAHELKTLQAQGNLRTLPLVAHDGQDIIASGRRMLNLSSNDYLGLAGEKTLQEQFWQGLSGEDTLLSASSSRLLTGNFSAYTRLEQLLAALFGREAALVFGSGYHMNTGILPAVTDSSTLILADKLVHASLIDGIRLSGARSIRFRHQDYAQLENLLQKYHADFPRIIIVTESIFSMDGDTADLLRLTGLKKQYPGTMLYVDEAHGIGVRGRQGLGLAEELDCIGDIDFLCGTFGKALASVGAYVVCNRIIRDYLVNKMRTLIFTTALPPLNVAWTQFVMERLADMTERRQRLTSSSTCLRNALKAHGWTCPSESHIVPMIVGDSHEATQKAEQLQKLGYYVLPVRPPTVPPGTSRLRFSLNAGITPDELKQLTELL